MLKLAVDENFNGRILRGLRRALPDIDVVRVQDTQLAGAEDAEVLSWAAEERRILLTHDVSTMAGFAFERVQRGESMPGLVEVPVDLALGVAIADIVLVVTAGRAGEWEGRVLFLPL